MKNIIGIRREGIAKTGEKRTAVTPGFAAEIVKQGHRLIVQPAVNPETREVKRAFQDEDYIKAGAVINEDLSGADVIFGLKEINVSKILHGKAYYFFSHTHKGQIKNRGMLKALIERKNTVVDYELIRDDKNHRLITAFTYNAGYAGMVDTLWTLGKRLKAKGIKNLFEQIPQSIEVEDLRKIKEIIREAGKQIEKEGTPKEIPPVITAFLGKGKTSKGAQMIYDLLPVQEIKSSEIKSIYKKGSRNKMYKLVLGKDEIYKLKPGEGIDMEEYKNLNKREREHHYMMYPEFYESDLNKILPFAALLMNCVVWSPKFPRSVTKELMKTVFFDHKTLKVIGDITCDPNGSIEFSKETWIDNPVYIYNPFSETLRDGFDGEGVAVMAVTNLPCEFSTDASIEFGNNLSPYLKGIIDADYSGSLENSNLPPEIKKGVILWKGEFTDEFFYMKRYVTQKDRFTI